MLDPANMQYAFRWLATWGFLALLCYALFLYAQTLWAYYRLSSNIPKYWPFVGLLSAIAALKVCPVELPSSYMKAAVYLEIIPLFLVLFARGKCSPRVKKRPKAEKDD